MHECMHVCMHACMHVCMYVCKHACMYVCMHACLHVCMYVCMYACTCIPAQFLSLSISLATSLSDSLSPPDSLSLSVFPSFSLSTPLFLSPSLSTHTSCFTVLRGESGGARGVRGPILADAIRSAAAGFGVTSLKSHNTERPWPVPAAWQGPQQKKNSQKLVHGDCIWRVYWGSDGLRVRARCA